MGPVASQEVIKMPGTNGSGFVNANSAQPYENLTGASNLVQMLSIFLIPAALCFMFGAMVGDMRQAWRTGAGCRTDLLARTPGVFAVTNGGVGALRGMLAGSQGCSPA